MHQWATYQPTIGSAIFMLECYARTYVAIQQFLCEPARLHGAAVATAVACLAEGWLGEGKDCYRSESHR